MSKDKQLTVAEVIKLLEDMPQDALVWSEGCDCDGETRRVVYDPERDTVIMARV